MQKARFLTAFWALAKPYWISEQRAKGLVLLGTVIGLSLGIVWLEVQFNTWNKNFFNALEQKNQPEFVRQLWTFSVIAFVWILARVYQIYLQQMLQIEWRAWLNDHLLADWLKDRAYYRLQLIDRGVDNPDQRIAEDLRLFVDNTLELSGAFTIGGVAIPGFMFWVALIYTGIGSWLTYKIGRPLVKLNFNQQRFEADYRYALVRLRENSEGVALYKGEELELGNFRERFRHVIDNWWGIMRTRKQLNWFVSFFYQFSVPFPYLVAAPRYFSGAVGMGYIFQVGNSFTNVRSSLMWFIDAYTQLASWKATIDRLTSFSESLERVKSEARELGGERAEAGGDTIGIEALQLALPQGQPLLAPTSIQFRPGEDVLVTGPSGAGKSTFFRALAVTMTVSLFTSLGLALVWTPNLSRYFVRRKASPSPGTHRFAPDEFRTGADSASSPGDGNAVATREDEMKRLMAAEEADNHHLRIYTVGIGTPAGELVRIADDRGNPTFLKDNNGNVADSRWVFGRVSYTAGKIDPLDIATLNYTGLQTVDFGDLRLFVRPNPVPRSLVVFGASTAENDAAALERMRQSSFDSNREVVLSAQPLEVSPSSAHDPIPVQPDVARQTGADVELVRQHRGMPRHQQHVVEGECRCEAGFD